MSPFIRPLFAATCLALTLSGTVAAQEIAVFGPPSVEYEGQRTIVTSEGSIVQSVHAKPGKNRTEFHRDGQTLIQIWRDDLRKLWSISPEQGVAMEASYGTDQAQSPLDGFDEQSAVLEKRYIGKEVVNGVMADHHFMRVSMSGGGTTSGDVWTTTENVTVRMRMTQTSAGQGSEQISYDLTNLRLVSQPDILFEVPEGYQLAAAGEGMPLIFSSAGGYAGDLASDAAEEAKSEVDRQVRQKVRNETSKAVRKILPW